MVWKTVARMSDMECKMGIEESCCAPKLWSARRLLSFHRSIPTGSEFNGAQQLNASCVGPAACEAGRRSVWRCLTRRHISSA